MHTDIIVIMGRKEDEAFSILLKEVGIEDKITPKEYIKEYDAMLAEMFLKCKAMPGAEKLVRHFCKKGRRLFFPAYLSHMCSFLKVYQQQYVPDLGARHLAQGGNPIKIGWIS
ncbi:hypothetical protein ANCDUO_26811 [Ancylostoma duodenale]|uniref:Uncharacterized protein n=1 Tax=Ancylostoma duodenale TaxID=51022 RepID=A0A0C2F8E7_9BILA|nr:hypothetical protein ANCDUO_26811 [Ancylostoma duodenale]